MERIRLKRMLELVTTLQSGQIASVETLAAFHGVSRRTVFRDLQELQEAGVGFSYDASSGRYRTCGDNYLKPLNLSQTEALSLLLLACKADGPMSLPFGKTALSAAEKLVDRLPDAIRQFCRTALRNVSVKAEPQLHGPCSEQVFWQVEQAIHDRQIVKVQYRKLSGAETVTTELNPVHMIWNWGSWYVVGKSSLHGCIRALRLDRVTQLTRTNTLFTGTDTFDAKEYLRRAWSSRCEGRSYTVLLRFAVDVARDVVEIQWHETQKVHFQKDGSAIVEFCVDGLNEIVWWILGYGDRVQVLAPAALRKRIAQIARGTIERNQSALLGGPVHHQQATGSCLPPKQSQDG